MDLRGWMSESVMNVRADGLQGVNDSLYPVYKKLLHQVFRFADSGVPIYECDWDVLIVLDACRVDLIQEVADDFGYIGTVDSVKSVDTMTREWMRDNFRADYKDEMAETVYICGNPMSQKMLEANDFVLLDEVWKYAWDDELGTMPPRPITDRGIELGRSRSPERMILHYMQPHYPFVPQPDLDHGIDVDRFGELPWDNVWDRLRKGELERTEVWNAYRENLEYVLEDIKLLLQNVDADTVVVTSDHGNALGEGGIYGHPIHMPIDSIKMVPWILTSAEDHSSYDPDTYKIQSGDSDVEDRLQQLGYHN